MPAPPTPVVNAQPLTTATPEEEELHRHFPHLPPKEKLVQSCSCSLIRRKLARIGRMYVTPLHICFASSFIDEPLVIGHEDVLTFERKTSFVWDTIVVVTKTRSEYYFTAFMSTSATQMYNLLRTLWSVRQKYAADRASSVSTDSDTDVSSSVSNNTSRRGSHTSSAPGILGTGNMRDLSRDLQVASQPTRLRSRDNRESDVSVKSNRAAVGQLSSPIESSLVPREKQGVTEVSDEKVVALDRHKSGSPDSSGDLRITATVEFRRFFPSLPQTETTKDSFTCCYQFGASRLGKMWITQNFILFVSPMMESRIQINFSDVEKIEKEQKLVLLDGFYVLLKTGVSMSFSNFPSRDTAVNVIETAFQAAKEANEDPGSCTTASGTLVFKTSTCENDASKIPCATSIDALSQVETDYGTALSDTSCFTKEVISPVKLCAGRSVLDVFGVCFDDGSSLLEDYHAERNDTDQKWEPWRATKDGGVFRGQRQFQCTTLVKAMMGKPYGYVEYERYALLNVNGILTLALQFSSQVPGVLFGEAFRVEVLMTFTQTGSGADCEVTMQVFGYVQFLKSVWVKSRILSTTMNTELPEGYKKLAEMISSRVKAHQRSMGRTDEVTAEYSPEGEQYEDLKDSVTKCKPYSPLLHKIWPLEGYAANCTVLVLSSTCFFVSFFYCLVMSFSPIGVSNRRGVLQSLVSPLTAVITALIAFVSFQISVAAFVALEVVVHDGRTSLLGKY